MSRTIAIGDIHGCAVALSRLLQEVAPEKSDTIVGIGDYVDRGIYGIECMLLLSPRVAIAVSPRRLYYSSWCPASWAFWRVYNIVP